MKKRKNSVLTILLLIILFSFILAGGVYINSIGRFFNLPNKNLSKPEIAQPSCTLKDQVSLQKNSNNLLLVDLINKYQLDVSILPDIQNLEVYPTNCKKIHYEVDIYKPRTNTPGSTARLEVWSDSNNSNLNLIDFAKENYHYAEGKHTNPGVNYNRSFDSSPIMDNNLINGLKIISWKEIYTQESTYVEGTTAAKYYLLSLKDKVIVFKVFAWDIPNFNRATQDFDKVIKTFKILN